MANEVTADRIMQLGLGFWGSKVLLSAIELGLFTLLAKGSRDGESIRAELKLHERSSRDFLDALVALGMLARGTDGRYANTPESSRFLDRNQPTYIGGILEMANERLYPFWGALTEGLKTGKPQNEIKSGDNLFEALYSDPHRLKLFLKSMTGLSLGIAHAMANKFPWREYKTFADVGCAQGGTPVTIAEAHPHLSGIGADLAVVQPVFDEFVAARNLSGRLHFEPCDMFREPLPKADVIVMGHILHDWGMEQKRQLIAKAYDALPSGGAFIVYEAIIDDDRSRNAFGLLMSLNMLIETRDGFDFTGADCQGWMAEAGFRESYVQHLLGPTSMVVGIK